VPGDRHAAAAPGAHAQLCAAQRNPGAPGARPHGHGRRALGGAGQRREARAHAQEWAGQNEIVVPHRENRPNAAMLYKFEEDHPTNILQARRRPAARARPYPPLRFPQARDGARACRATTRSCGRWRSPASACSPRRPTRPSACGTSSRGAASRRADRTRRARAPGARRAGPASGPPAYPYPDPNLCAGAGGPHAAGAVAGGDRQEALLGQLRLHHQGLVARLAAAAQDADRRARRPAPGQASLRTARRLPRARVGCQRLRPRRGARRAHRRGARSGGRQRAPVLGQLRRHRQGLGRGHAGLPAHAGRPHRARAHAGLLGRPHVQRLVRQDGAAPPAPAPPPHRAAARVPVWRVAARPRWAYVAPCGAARCLPRRACAAHWGAAARAPAPRARRCACGTWRAWRAWRRCRATAAPCARWRRPRTASSPAATTRPSRRARLPGGAAARRRRAARLHPSAGSPWGQAAARCQGAGLRARLVGRGRLGLGRRQGLGDGAPSRAAARAAAGVGQPHAAVPAHAGGPRGQRARAGRGRPLPLQRLLGQEHPVRAGRTLAWSRVMDSDALARRRPPCRAQRDAPRGRPRGA